jgi:hypothetical protein
VRLLLCGLALLGASFVGYAAIAQSAAGQGGATRLAAALDRLDAWLGDGDNGDRWRRYLHANELRAELAKAAQADPALVARILQRYREPVAGLDLGPFVAVRDAIQAWLAELKRQYQDDLVKLAWASRGDHTPISAEQFREIRADLRAKSRALETALGRNTPLAAGWKKYLRWEMLEPHLADDFVPDEQSLADLDEVLRRFRNNEPGLELPVFTDVAKAIARYRALAVWAVRARSDDTRPIYDRFLMTLQRYLERHIERPSIETNRQLARGVGLIDSLGQSPEFVRAVRARYAQSNVFGAASADFIRRMPDRTVRGVEPVRDYILGTTIRGTANTLRNVRYELGPSDDSVELAVYLDGEAQSRTRGYHQPVQINSTGRTEFHAVKRISLREDDFTSTSAAAWVDTRTRIRSIQKTGGRLGHKLIERIAWQRALEQKRQAEIISAQHTEHRILREFDEIVARDLAAARGRYELQIRAPLIRRGVSPEYVRMKSGPGGVSIETVFARRNQLAAADAPPAMLPGHDLSLQIHESAVNNYLPLALASARIAQETADIPPSLEGNVPLWLKGLAIGAPKLAAAASAGVEIVQEAQERVEEALGAEPDVTPPPFKPYSITLNAEAPASAQFDDNKIAVRIRAATLATEEREYRNWDFIVTYEITQERGRILLKRVDDIEVFPTGFDVAWPTPLTAEQSGLRNVLAKNMNARAQSGQSFPAEIPIEPVRLSRFGVLVLRELVADNGWLTIGWGLP